MMINIVYCSNKESTECSARVVDKCRLFGGEREASALCEAHVGPVAVGEKVQMWERLRTRVAAPLLELLKLCAARQR